MSVKSGQHESDEVILIDHVGIKAPAGAIDKLNDCDVIGSLKDRIKKTVWEETGCGAQHRFFLGLSYRYGIGRKPDEEKAEALLSAAAEEGTFPDRL